jgi:hypothetical protein
VGKSDSKIILVLYQSKSQTQSAVLMFKINLRGKTFYRAFQGFGQVKFPNGGLALGSSQFSILPQLHQKMMLASKGVKIDSKISNWRR